MSTVSSVGGYGSELLQMLQKMKLQQSGESTGTGGAQQIMSRLGEGMGGNRAQQFDEQLASFAEDAGLDTEKAAALKADVQAAVQSAMEQADGSTDHRELVKNAVSSTLESYGLDAEAFDEKMKANAPPPPTGGMGGMGQMFSGDSATATSASTDATALTQLLSLLNGGSDSSGLLANLSLLDTAA